MNIVKKMSIALSLCAVFGACVVSTSMAATATCTNAAIEKVGPYSGIGAGVTSDNIIRVTCISDTTWGTVNLFPSAAIGDQALATALTALSLGKNVLITASAKTTGSMLIGISVSK